MPIAGAFKCRSQMELIDNAAEDKLLTENESKKSTKLEKTTILK